MALCIAFISGQILVKHKSKILGEGKAQISKWSFKVNGNSKQMKEINLIYQNEIDEDSITENKIAPGSSGYFDIIIDTTESDVGIDYKITFENEQGKPSNLIFTYNDVDYNSLKSLENVLYGSIATNSQEKIKVFPIDWRWEYQTGNSNTEIQKNNEIDTKDAMNISNYTFDIIVTGTQSKPKKS